jgi:group I intron endonuclease
MIIYKVTNKINGKSYIGQTTKTLIQRKRAHYNAMRYDNYYFHNALKKYNKEDFEWKIIEKCNSAEELNEMEFHYIKQYKSHKLENGYNISFGGSGGDNFTNNPNKEFIRQKLIDRWKNKKHPWIGKKHTEETKRKISEKAKNRTFSDETIKKFSKIRKNMVGKKNPLSKKWKIIFPNEEEIIVYILRNFCNTFEKEKLDFGAMQRTANGKQKSHKGYKCEYIN